MKRSACVLFGLLFIAVAAKSQSIYVGMGYNHSIIKPDGIDFVVGRYNQTRGYLETPMKMFNAMNGFTLDASFFTSDNIGLNMSYTGRSRTMFAEGVDQTNTLQRREVRTGYGSVGFGAMYSMYPKGRHLMLGLGTEFQLNIRRFKTRVGKKNLIESRPWTDAGTSLGFNLVLMTRFHYRFITVQPYYSFDLSNFEVSELNREINPNTAGNDPDEIPNKMNHFGVKLMLALNVRDD